MTPHTQSMSRGMVAVASWASNMPSHTLEAMAMSVLEQRGMPPTPQNIQAIKNALEDNPDLLDNVRGMLQHNSGPDGEARFNETRPSPMVFRDQFDDALDTAVDDVGTSTIASSGGATFPAPPVEGVEVKQLLDIVTQLPPEVQNDIMDAIQGGSGEVSGGVGVPPPQGDEEGGPIPIPLAVPGKKGTDVAIRRGVGLPATQGGAGAAQGALPSPQGALPPPPRQLPPPQGALPPPQAALPAPDNPLLAAPTPRPSVADEVGASVVADDAVEVERGAKIKQTTFEGRPAATFRIGKDQIVTPDGKRFAVKSNTGADLVDVRSESLLERIMTFLKANAQELRTVLRSVR